MAQAGKQRTGQYDQQEDEQVDAPGVENIFRPQRVLAGTFFFRGGELSVDDDHDDRKNTSDNGR